MMKLAPSTLFIQTFFWIFGIYNVVAGPVNVTVDDTLGDPVTGKFIIYSSSNWKDGRSCVGCSSHPDTSMVFSGTWTDSSFSGQGADVQDATFQFTGTAVYVFCILDIMLSADMTFYIDGTPDHSFVRPSVGTQSSFQYNVNVYGNEGLSNELHTLTIQNGRPGGKFASVLLDYIIYSRVDAVGSTPSQQPDRSNESVQRVPPTIITGPATNSRDISDTAPSISIVSSQPSVSALPTRVASSGFTSALDTVPATEQMTRPATSSPSADATALPTHSKISKRTLAIIAALCGVSGGAVLAAMLWYCFRCIGRRKQHQDTPLPEPFNAYEGNQTVFRYSDRSRPDEHGEISSATLKSLEVFSSGKSADSSVVMVTEQSIQFPQRSSVASGEGSSMTPVPAQAEHPPPEMALPFLQTDPAVSRARLRPVTWETVSALSDPPPSYA